MESMREIKQKMRAVHSIENVTRAMKMIASVRLRKIEQKMENSRPFAQAVRGVLVELAARIGGGMVHPLLEVRAVKNRCYLVVTSDRGLCGGYNYDVVRYTENRLGQDASARIITVGKFGYRYFRQHNYPNLTDYDKITDEVDYAVVRQLGAELIREYLNHNIDEINIIYTQYRGAANQRPVLLRLLPLAPEAVDEAQDSGGKEYLFEPSAEDVFLFLIPKYVNVVLYSAILEAKTSEQGARMLAMDTATKNAEELVADLTLQYNRSRQEAITEEIVEIMGAAELNR